MKKRKRHFAWFVFSSDDSAPLFGTAARTRRGAVNNFSSDIYGFGVGSRKVRRCEIRVLPTKRPSKKGTRQ